MRRGFKPKKIFLLAVIWIVGAGAFAKEKDVLLIPPPMAVAQEVATRAGCPATITLTVGGRIAEPLAFLIRRPPQTGVLGEIRRTGRNTAEVLYTPGGKAGAGGDSFTFAVQSFDSPVSAAARVRIRIVEAPPVLDFPREIDFGTVFLGQKAGQPLFLRNEGGGVSSGVVEADPPWSVAGAPGYQLVGGGKTVVPLEFAPSGEKEFVGSVRLGGDSRAGVVVRGRGAAPVTWSPEEVVIDSVRREAGGFSIGLVNRSPEPRIVIIDWPECVRAAREIPLQANGSGTVKAVIAPDFLLAFDGSLTLHSGGFTGHIPLRIAPAPARLELAPENELSLGEVKTGRSAHGRFRVKNTGGTDTRLRVIAARELNIFPDPSSLILSPGKEQTFEVQLEATKGGEYSGTIGIGADSGKDSELVVKALFAKEDAPAKGNSGPQPVAKFLQIAPVASSGAEPPLPAGSGSPIRDVSVLLSTPHEIEITWKQKSPEVKNYRIERRRILPGANNTVLVEWVPWPEARVSIRDGNNVARFERMPSDGTWTFRIVALDASGAPQARSLPFRIFTQPTPSHTFLWWALGILGLGAVAAIGRKWRHHRRRLAEADDARIARIGKC